MGKLALQNYTTYSILSGLFEPKKWAESAKSKGYTSLAITDKTSLAGSILFEKECLSVGINPIIGEEFILIESRHSKKDNLQLGIILLYAKNEAGYKNLVAINNFAHSRGDEAAFYNKAKIDLEILMERSSDIICVVPADDGAGLQLDMPGKFADETPIRTLQTIFKDDLYFGINPLSLEPKIHDINSTLIGSFPDQLVFTYNSHYTEEDEAHLYDVIRQFDHGRSSKINMNDDRSVSRGFLPKDDTDYLPNITGVVKAKCQANMDRIEESCHFRFERGKVKMPDPIVDQGVDEDIENWCVKSINKKFSLDVKSLDEFLYDPFLETQCPGIKVYQERLEEELSVIRGKDFMPYFHHVKKICDFHDTKYETRGAGRGSAGGSLLCYILGLTHIDSVRFKLLFSRFLDAERSDLPDIDLDFSSEGRDFIIDGYLKKEFGESRIVNVSTYTRIKTKSGLNAYHSAFGGGFPADDGTISFFTPTELHEMLNIQVPATYRGDKELTHMRERSEQFDKFCTKHSRFISNILEPMFEGILNPSKHASAKIITHDHIDNCWPVFFEGTKDSKEPQIQMEYPLVEECGGVKFDLLVVDGVSIIDKAKQIIRANNPDVIFPEYDEIDLEDPNVLGLFANSRTHGISQFKSKLQRNHMPLLRPKRFADLSAAVALIRPGPMAMDAHTKHAQAVNGEIEVSYPIEGLRPILEHTSGFTVYQEQAMKIAHDICSFTVSETNKLRKVMGKKLVNEMPKWKEKFVNGGAANGHDKEIIEVLWDTIAAFAEYSFNESHAVAYTLVAYYSAYLKYYYPLEFWCSVLSNAKRTTHKSKDDDLYSLKPVVEEEGFDFIYPSVKGFASEFKPRYPDAIFWPLGSVKKMGIAATHLESFGSSFASLDEFLEYTCTVKDEKGRLPVNIGHIKTLIKIGFFAPFGKPTKIAEKVFDYRKEVLKKKEEIPPDLCDEKTPLYWAELKNSAYGFEVSKWKDIAEFSESVRSYTHAEFRNIPDGENLAIGGRVTSLYINRSDKGRNKGQYYATLTIKDGSEEYKIRLWSDFWSSEEMDRMRNRPRKGDLYEIVGKKNIWNGRHQVSVGAYENTHSRVIWREGL